MNAIKQVIVLAGKSQKEASEICDIKQSLLSYQMNNNIIGTIEKSINIAKKLGVNKYEIEENGFKISIKIK